MTAKMRYFRLFVCVLVSLWTIVSCGSPNGQWQGAWNIVPSRSETAWGRTVFVNPLQMNAFTNSNVIPRSSPKTINDNEDDDDDDDDDEDESRKKGGFGLKKKKKYYQKLMLPLLLAYKLKFFTLIPLMVGGLVLLTGATGLAGFFFALFAAVMGLKTGSSHHH